MYCIKVPEGRERKIASDYPYAFLPSYTCLKPLNPEKTEFGTERRLIVPGYIFTIRNERTAEHVPEKEWKIIEALSDPEPSYIDDQGKIVSGPLAKCNHLVTDVKDDNVRIQANLLEQDRIYWIRVRKAAEEAVPPKAEEPSLQTPDTEKKPAPIAQAAGEKKKDHIREQKEQILAEAEKVGIHAAGKSAGIPWQTVMRWAREAGRQIPSKYIQPVQKKRKEYPQEQKEKILADAEKVGIHAAAKTAGVPWQTVLRWAREAGKQIPSIYNQPIRKRTKKADAPEMPNAGKKPTVSPDLSTLKIENAALKERIAQLEEKIRELQNSLNNLIS